jgi:hypothetical protein
MKPAMPVMKSRVNLRDPDLVIQEECKKATDIMYIIGVIVTGNYYCARLRRIGTHTVAISTAPLGGDSLRCETRVILGHNAWGISQKVSVFGPKGGPVSMLRDSGGRTMKKQACCEFRDLSSRKGHIAQRFSERCVTLRNL